METTLSNSSTSITSMISCWKNSYNLWSHSSLSFGYFSKYFFIWMASMWIKCFVLESWIGISTTFSLKSVKWRIPFTTETSKLSYLNNADKFDSNSNLMPWFLSFSNWVFTNPAKPLNWDLSLLYLSSIPLIWELPIKSDSISARLMLGFWTFLNAALNLTISSSSSDSLLDALLSLSSRFWIFFSNSTIWFSFSLRRLVKSRNLDPP